MKFVFNEDELVDIIVNHIATKYLKLSGGRSVNVKGDWLPTSDGLTLSLEVEEKK